MPSIINENAYIEPERSKSGDPMKSGAGISRRQTGDRARDSIHSGRADGRANAMRTVMREGLLICFGEFKSHQRSG
jgi:hypothetical protein